MRLRVSPPTLRNRNRVSVWLARVRWRSVPKLQLVALGRAIAELTRAAQRRVLLARCFILLLATRYLAGRGLSLVSSLA